jgi:hypothetical protein
METVVNAKTVIEEEEVLEPFKIKKEVKQGCLLVSLLVVLSVRL